MIAVADYRHSRSDIGFAGSANGRIDLHARVSHDNGKTWDDITTIVEGQGKNATDPFYTGFGDPCIVADRETNDVLVLSCSGDISYTRASPGYCSLYQHRLRQDVVSTYQPGRKHLFTV